MTVRKNLVRVLLSVGTLLCTLSIWASSNNVIYPPSINGMTYAAYSQTGYQTSVGAAESLARLDGTGVNWISIIVTCYQQDINSTTINCSDTRTPSDASLAYVIGQAHAYGLKVMLKPQINLSNPSDPNSWRGNIGDQFTTVGQWSAWFNSYKTMISRYANLAKINNVDLLSIGTELEGTTQRTSDWTSVITTARSKFKGSLTYSANFDGEAEKIKWWGNSNLAYIGIDAYYALVTDTPVGEVPTVDELSAAWDGPMLGLASLSTKFRKPILFTEIGYRSVLGAHLAPWDGTTDANTIISEEEQTNLYQAVVNRFYTNTPSWFKGLFWWTWRPNYSHCGVETDYTPCGKPAEQVLINASAL